MQCFRCLQRLQLLISGYWAASLLCFTSMQEAELWPVDWPLDSFQLQMIQILFGNTQKVTLKKVKDFCVTDGGNAPGKIRNLVTARHALNFPANEVCLSRLTDGQVRRVPSQQNSTENFPCIACRVELKLLLENADPSFLRQCKRRVLSQLTGN